MILDVQQQINYQGITREDKHTQLCKILCFAKVSHYHWDVKPISVRRGLHKFSAPRYSLRVWGKDGTFRLRSEHGIYVKSWKRDLSGIEYSLEIVDGAMGTPIKALFLEN